MNTNHLSSICSARSQAGLGAGCRICGNGVSGRRGKGPDLRMARGPGRERQGHPRSCEDRNGWTGRVLKGEPNLLVRHSSDFPGYSLLVSCLGLSCRTRRLGTCFSSCAWTSLSLLLNYCTASGATGNQRGKGLGRKQRVGETKHCLLNAT